MLNFQMYKASNSGAYPKFPQTQQRATLNHYAMITLQRAPLQEIIIYGVPRQFRLIYFLFMYTRLLKAEKWIPLHEPTEQWRIIYLQ